MCYEGTPEVHMVTATDSEDRMHVVQVHLDKEKAEELAAGLTEIDAGSYMRYGVLSKKVIR